MKNNGKSSSKELSGRDQLFLEEYRCLLSLIQFYNDTMHRFSTFYFTSVSAFFGVFFLLIRGTFTTQDNLIAISLSVLGVLTTLFWYSNSSRSHVKLNSRMERTKQIEKHFKKEFGDCLQIFTYTGEHLQGKKDFEGKKLNVLTRQTKMLSHKYPMTLMILWLVILVLALVQYIGDIRIFGSS